jgi:iron complex outermembrane receptor protein
LFPPAGGTPIVFATAGTKSWREDDWKVGIEWDVADGTLLYASAATGFKSGGFFFSPVPNVDSFSYRPEDLLAYTLGSKSQFLDDRLQLNLELFDWDYQDQQVAALALIPPFIIFPQQNAEQSSITGVEAELRYLLADSTLLSFGAQLTDAKYDKFTLISAFPAAHCVTLAAGPPLVLDCSGNKLLNTPDTTVTLGIRHTFSLSAGGSLVLGVDARYESERLAGYNSYAVVEPNTRTDVRFAYESRGSWSVEAFVDNVTDEVVPIGVGASINLIPGLYSTGLRPPRTYGLRLALHF